MLSFGRQSFMMKDAAADILAGRKNLVIRTVRRSDLGRTETDGEACSGTGSDPDSITGTG